jgi:hypothetical protein
MRKEINWKIVNVAIIKISTTMKTKNIILNLQLGILIYQRENVPSRDLGNPDNFLVPESWD